MERRVLLLELVPSGAGRFMMEQSFPLLNGRLRREGIPVTWLRFALPAAVQLTRGEHGIGLDDGDAATLLEEVRRGAFTHALHNRPLAAALRALLERERLSLQHTTADEGAALAFALGEERGGGVALAAGDPDYSFVPANAAARELRAVAFVRSGVECFYRASVLDNPAYAGVDLSGCRTTGCAFCASGGSGDLDGPPIVEAALRQIDAFVSTHPLLGHGGRPAVRLAGYRFLAEAPALARAVAARPGPGLDLLLDARADQLVALEGRLRDAARALAGGDHRLHVCLVGIESFSRAELQRMNKGVEPWVNLAAIRVLRTLEADLPKTFRFSEHGGLSTILFTPWTSLDDLAVNLATVRHFQLEDVLGKLLQSRLRLEEGLPITALARRDGLVAAEYDDPALDTARRNFYSSEIPWRFLHPGVEAVNRVATRIRRDDSFREDPLYERVQAWVAGRGQVACAAEIVARARARPGATPEQLLAEDEGDAQTEGPVASPAAGDRSGAGRDAEILLALQRAGVSRVNRLEGLAPADAEAVASSLVAAGRHAERVALAGARSIDVFLGADASEVREAVELTRLLYGGPPAAEVARARRRIGELLGYPPCCVERFARATCSRPTLNEWLIVDLRAREPGAAPIEVDPFHPAVPYVPCSLTCERTIERVRRAASGLEAIGVSPPDGNPVLFLLDRPGASLRLVPDGPVGASFGFTTAGAGGRDPRLAAVATGGRITVDGGAIVVERGGSRVASFFLDAAVFWAGAPFDPELWREASAHVLDPRGGAAAPALAAARAAAASAPAADEADGAMASRVSAALAAVRGHVADHAALAIRRAAGERALLTLARRDEPSERLDLYVGSRSSGAAFYVACGDLVITVSKHTPVRTASQRRAVAALATLLSCAGSPGPGGRGGA